MKTFMVALPDTVGRHRYLCTGEGDPPRTYRPEHAIKFNSRHEAEQAMEMAHLATPFRKRTIIVLEFLT